MLFKSSKPVVLLCVIIMLTGYAVPAYTKNKVLPGDRQKIYLTPPSKKIAAVINTKKRPKAILSNNYYWFDNTTIHETKGGYSGYILDGAYTEYYFPGNELSVSGDFKNGVKKGKWLSWYQSGTIKERTQWKKGKLNGKKYTYAANGSLTCIERYKKGLLNGRKVNFSTDSSSMIIHYRKGVVKSEKHFWGHRTHRNDSTRNTPQTTLPPIDNNRKGITTEETKITASKKESVKKETVPANKKKEPEQGEKKRKKGAVPALKNLFKSGDN